MQQDTKSADITLLFAHPFWRLRHGWFRMIRDLLLAGTAVLFLLFPSSLALEHEDNSSAFLRGHDVNSCCFLGNETLLTVSSKGDLCLWELKTAMLKKRYTWMEKPAYGVSVIDNGKKVMGVCGHDHIIVFDLSKERIVATIKMPSDIVKVIATPGSKRLFAACTDGKIRILDFESGKELGHLEPAFAGRPMPINVTAVIGNEVCRETLGPSSQPKPLDLSLSPDGKVLAASYARVLHSADKQIHIWDTDTLKLLHTYRIDGTSGGFISFQPKRPSELALTGRDCKSISVWDLAKETAPKQRAELHSWVRFIRYSPDGSLLVHTCLDGSVYTMRGSDPSKLLCKYPDPPIPIYGLAFSPDSAFLAITTFDARDKTDKVFVWELVSGKPFLPRQK